MADMMNLIQNRHSVRSFTDEPLAPEVRARLVEEIEAVNQIGRLHVQLISDDPKAFTNLMARYGKFHNVQHYLALVGPNTPRLDELCGYFGEHLVLLAQELGLHTCWVGLTYNRRKARIQKAEGERLVAVIALGHGKNNGASHKVKEVSEVSSAPGEAPDWFVAGVRSALLAPTAMNQQKFFFELTGEQNAEGKPIVRATFQKAHFSEVDFGIAKYHFEVAAGTDSFAWG